MEVVKAGHSVYRLQYHVVWVCKCRRRILNPAVCTYLRRVLPKPLRSMPGAAIETIGFDRDRPLYYAVAVKLLLTGGYPDAVPALKPCACYIDVAPDTRFTCDRSNSIFGPI